MTRPPSKRLRSKQARAEEPRPVPPPAQAPDSTPAIDSDPAGRLLRKVQGKAGTSSTPPAPLEPGAKVRVLRGPFMGRSGVVQELDGRGGARVMLGLLSTRIDLKDLAVTDDDRRDKSGKAGGGRERMTLSSSHRKPR